METDVTAMSSAASATAAGTTDEPDVLFGTRACGDRPHSMNLSRATQSAATPGAARGLEVLLGIGIGAVAMYYLDPDGGPRRRARIRDRIVGAVAMAPDALRGGADRHLDWSPTARLVAGTLGTALAAFGARRRDAFGTVLGVVGSALVARSAAAGRRRAAPTSSAVVPGPVGRGDAAIAIERPALRDRV